MFVNFWNMPQGRVPFPHAFKETIRIIKSDSLFKVGDARFTTVPLKPSSDQ